MLVKDAVARIRFQTNTNDDNTGKNINALFSNKNLVSELQLVLAQYASFTKALESLYSTPVLADTRSVTGPSDIIRGEGYKFIELWLQGRKYPINIKSLNTTQTEFPNMTSVGIPQYVSVWEDELSFFPVPSSSRSTTSNTEDISSTDTTITVTSTVNFPPQNGRLTVNDEKIRYASKTTTEFLGCTRAIEGTLASSHGTSSTIQENNLFIFYKKRPFTILVDDSDIISTSDLEKNLEIPEEHMPGILDLTTYNLLSKIDPERAAPYKMDAAAFLQAAKIDIDQGRSAIVRGGFIGQAYDWERDNIGVYL